MKSLPIKPSEFKDWSKRAYVVAYNIFRNRLDRSEKFELAEKANDVAAEAWLNLSQKKKYRSLSTIEIRKIYFVTVFRLANQEADKIKRRKTVPLSSIIIGDDNSDELEFLVEKMEFVSGHFSRQADLVFFEETFEKLMAAFNDPEERDIAEIDLRSKARNRDQKFELYQSIYSEVQDDSDDGKWYFFKRLLRVRRKARHHLMKLMQEKK